MLSVAASGRWSENHGSAVAGENGGTVEVRCTGCPRLAEVDTHRSIQETGCKVWSNATRDGDGVGNTPSRGHVNHKVGASCADHVGHLDVPVEECLHLGDLGRLRVFAALTLVDADVDIDIDVGSEVEEVVVNRWWAQEDAIGSEEFLPLSLVERSPFLSRISLSISNHDKGGGEREGVGSLTLCVNVLEELEEVLSLLQGIRGEINVWHNWRSHDCRDGSQAEEDLGKHLDVFEKKSCVSVKEDAVGECLER